MSRATAISPGLAQAIEGAAAWLGRITRECRDANSDSFRENGFPLVTREEAEDMARLRKKLLEEFDAAKKAEWQR